MSVQQELHAEALENISNLKRIIDKLKAAGKCPLDGDNAIENIREHLNGILVNRLPRPSR